MPFGQLDRLPAVLRRPGKRPPDVERRLVRQAEELQIRPPDPARQRDALLQVWLGLLEPGRPVLGDAQVDQRQRAQVLAQAGPRRVRGLGSANEGAHHWWHQRVTAGSNLFLMLWLLISIARQPAYDFAALHAWLAAPWVAARCRKPQAGDVMV